MSAAAAPQLLLPGDRRNLAKSATRALEVLEYFVTVKRPVRAVEASHALHWRSSSTDQLLKTLVDSGYLIFDPQNKHYRISPRLVHFSAWLAQDFYGADSLFRLLQLLYSRLNEVITLATRQGDHMQLMDVLSPPNLPPLATKGLKVPLIGSAIGTAYLAALPDDKIRAIVEQIGRFKKPLPQRLESLFAAIANVRLHGYATGGISVLWDSWSIAMALPPCNAQVGLVLGVAGPAEELRSRTQALAEIMKACIAECLIP